MGMFKEGVTNITEGGWTEFIFHHINLLILDYYQFFLFVDFVRSPNFLPTTFLKWALLL